MQEPFHNNFTTDEYTKVIGEALARDEGGNKGTFGKLLVIAGSRGMAGAAYLCGMAAFRTGIGSVRFYTPECNRMILQILLPEAMTDTYTEDKTEREKQAVALAGQADAIVLGPGIGQTEAARSLVRYILGKAVKPLVVDADALNLVAAEPDLLSSYQGPCVITPHPGEMARLLRTTVEEILSDREHAVQTGADRWGVTTLLKGSHSLIAAKDGTIWRNETGNSGMAVAGSGDVLSGITGGLLARGLEETSALRLAVYAHGLAGDRASSMIGKNAMTARDILTYIPEVLPK